MKHSAHSNGRSHIKNNGDFHPSEGDLKEKAYLRSLASEPDDSTRDADEPMLRIATDSDRAPSRNEQVKPQRSLMSSVYALVKSGTIYFLARESLRFTKMLEARKS